MTAGKCILGHSSGDKCIWVKWDFAGSDTSHLVSQIPKVCQHMQQTQQVWKEVSVYHFQSIQIFLFTTVTFPSFHFNSYHRTIHLCHIWKQSIVFCFSLMCLLVQCIICLESRILTPLPKRRSNRSVFWFVHKTDSLWYWSWSKNLDYCDNDGYHLNTSVCFPQKQIHIFVLLSSLGDGETTANQECEIALSYSTSYDLVMSSNTWYCIFKV